MNLTDGFDLIDPASYAASRPPRDAWTALRRHYSVNFCEPRDYPPFWAIARHADICEISKQPEKFLSQPGIIQPRTSQIIDCSAGDGAMRTIIEMDPPEHRRFRKVTSAWFTPRAMNRIDAAVQASAANSSTRSRVGRGRAAPLSCRGGSDGGGSRPRPRSTARSSRPLREASFSTRAVQHAGIASSTRAGSAPPTVATPPGQRPRAAAWCTPSRSSARTARSRS